MTAVAFLLAVLFAVAGTVAYLATGNIVFLVLAGIGLVTGVSGYVLAGGALRSR